jgi:rod shape-determining protein MreC
VDSGSGEGVNKNDPVIGPGGLVGLVTTVGSDFSVVTELTDAGFAVGAQVQDSNGDSGVLRPAVGNPGSLLLQDLPANTTDVVRYQLVVTSGFEDPADSAIRSYYPPDIPIGFVSSVNANTVLNDQEVTVSPSVDLHNLSVVQILTRPYPPSAERASVSTP